jgi:hypothetical protein
MEFTVPQFIEYEAKVIGPFTFKQFIIVAAAGVICAIAFFELPFFIYIPIWILVGGGTLFITFVKIQGLPPLTVLKNFFFFSMAPRIFIWQRKMIMPKIIKKEFVKKEEEIEENPLKVRQGKLGNLSTKISTKTE